MASYMRKSYYNSPRDSSTADVRGVIFHEIGHALMTYFVEMETKFPELLLLEEELNSLAMQQYRDVYDKEKYISLYGSQDNQELVAEAFAYHMARKTSSSTLKREPELKAAIPVLDILKKMFSITNPGEDLL